MRGKRGVSNMIILFGILFVVLFLGFVIVVGSSTMNWVMDEAVPLVTDLGVIDGWNASATTEMVITPVNSFIQSMTWISGIMYVMMLLGCIGIAFSFRAYQSKWLIGFFFLLVIMLMIGSIFVSNMYESFLTDNSEFSDIMYEHGIMTYLILYSPIVFGVIAFISGIIMFSGRQEEQYV